MANIVTAIDIGSSNIKTVIALIDEEGKAKVIGESSHPSYGVKKGEITGIDEAINSIAASLTGAEKMAGLTVSSAFVSINGKNIISNNNKGVVAISDSEILEDDVYRAIEQARTVAIPQSRQIIHTIPREFVVDQQSGIKNPVGMTGTRLEVDAHIISAPTTAIHNLERCIQTIGLRIDSVVFAGWASAQSVLTSTEKELGVLLLDIGGGTTTITTFVEDAITYSSSIPFGGTNVTRDLAAGLRMSLDEAERVKVNIEEIIQKSQQKNTKKKKSESDKNTKKKEEESEELEEEVGDILDVTELGIENQKTISKKLFNVIVNDRITEIFEYILENIEQSGNEYKLPAGIVITGGAASLPGITALAKQVFGVPARVALPKGLEGLIDGISTPEFAALQGMIINAIAQGDYSSDSGFGGRSSIKVPGVGNKLVNFLKGFLP